MKEGTGKATMTATTATTVDLGTCARALSDIVARERTRRSTTRERDEDARDGGRRAEREGVGDVGEPASGGGETRVGVE